MVNKKPAGRSLPGNPIDFQHQRFAAPRRTAEIEATVLESAVSASNAVLNLREAAAILHCHPKTLRLMARAKKIPARRVGKLWRFAEHRIREWLEAS